MVVLRAWTTGSASIRATKRKFSASFIACMEAKFPEMESGSPCAKKIIKAHGGAIWVESEPGTGSKFFFTLPKQAVES